MGRLLTTWAREHRWAWLAGVGLWLVVAALGGALAGGRSKPVWPFIVTLDEWVVAIGLLSWLVVPLITPVNSSGVWAMVAAQRRAASSMGGGMALVSAEDMRNLAAQAHREGLTPAVLKTVRLIQEFTWALALVFLLDLLARAVLGLGLTAF